MMSWNGKRQEKVNFVVKQESKSTLLDAKRGQHLRTAFQTLAKLNTFGDIEDPVAWQKQIRQDRPLP